MKLSHTGGVSSSGESVLDLRLAFTFLLRALGRILFSALILSNGLGSPGSTQSSMSHKSSPQAVEEGILLSSPSLAPHHVGCALNRITTQLLTYDIIVTFGKIDQSETKDFPGTANITFTGQLSQLV